MIFVETSVFTREIKCQGVADMKEDTYAKLVASIKEAGEIKAGNRPPSRTYEIPPPEIRMVRERLDVSQGEFAVMIGVSTRTLQNWEQGRRHPEGPAKALLTIAARNPSAVLDALHGKRTGPTPKSGRVSSRTARVANT
jgi:putative transcriptional regulator